MTSEKERIEQVYRERSMSVPDDLYSCFNPGNLFMIHERERVLLRLLARYGMTPLSGKHILEVGCGTGGELRNLVRFGASPSLLVGIDVLADRIFQARSSSPDIRFVLGSAEELPFESDSFDIVTQFTLFSSILDPSIRASVARHMTRVLRPGGIIVWYDLRYSNPRNREVRGITSAEINLLFPGCSIEHRSITLLPPLARWIAPISWTAASLLDAVPFLRSHIMAVMTKERSSLG